jgi:site-specific DNA recombinase
MNGFIRSASYLRVSSQRQADENTIDSQQVDVLRRSVRDNTTIDPQFEYIDDGYSGSELLRPALERLRDHIAAGMIDRLYIHSPDRLARKFAHQAILLEEIDKHACEVIFLNQEGLPDSPETKMLIQMQGMFAEYEREKILERTRRGRRHSASQGNVSVFGRAPYGYRYFSKSASQAEACWEIDPTESKTVRLMFELVGTHGYSLTAVCRELKSQDIVTKTGQQDWCITTVRGMLRNPAYCGEARYGKKRLSSRKPGRRAKRGDPVVPRQAKVAIAAPLAEQIMIPVPALVSKSLFKEVGVRMDENRKRQRERQAGAKYLLSGLLICGKCGSAYCQNGGSRYHYYRCIGADSHRRGGKPICDNTSIKGGELDSRVWSDVCKLLREPERLQAEVERTQSNAPESSNSISKQESQVNELRSRVDRMIDAYAVGLIDSQEFESRIGGLRSQHDREAAALASLRGEQACASDAAAATDVLAALAAAVDQNLEAASFDLKRDLMKLLIKRIEICSNEIRIVYKVPPNPFVPSPDNRGILQHWLSCRHTPSA